MNTEIQTKPTLHEIAAMPFPASQQAMREHYDKDWHRDHLPPDENGKRNFRVRFDWTLCGSFDDEIEAENEAEAEEIAREAVQDDYYSGRLEVDFLEIESADPKDRAAAKAYADAMITKATGGVK